MVEGVRVLHVVGGGRSGGAARGALFLHDALVGLGMSSRVLVADRGREPSPREEPGVVPMAPGALGPLRTLGHRRLDQVPLLAYRNRPAVHFDTGLCGYPIHRSEAYRWADVIHLHYVNDGLLSVSGLRSMDKPVLWTLRDMWPMTGGCHYALDCTGYCGTCGTCPALGSGRRHDLSTLLQHRKRAALPKRLHLVAISQWMAECARRSTVLGGKPLSVIHNGIDTERFRPCDRAAALGELGLALRPEEPLILAGAVDHSAPYKGYDLLCEALSKLPLQRGVVALFGRVPAAPQLPKGLRYVPLGTLRDHGKLRAAYAAADVFVASSRQEAFGKTLVEAMACGAPVVAFDATGPRDIVEHGRNGYLAEPFSPAALARGIAWTLEGERARALRVSARERAASTFDIQRCANAYAERYHGLLQTPDATA